MRRSQKPDVTSRMYACLDLQVISGNRFLRWFGKSEMDYVLDTSRGVRSYMGTTDTRDEVSDDDRQKICPVTRS